MISLEKFIFIITGWYGLLVYNYSNIAKEFTSEYTLYLILN